MININQTRITHEIRRAVNSFPTMESLVQRNDEFYYALVIMVDYDHYLEKSAKYAEFVMNHKDFINSFPRSLALEATILKQIRYFLAHLPDDVTYDDSFWEEWDEVVREEMEASDDELSEWAGRYMILRPEIFLGSLDDSAVILEAARTVADEVLIASLRYLAAIP